MSEFYCLVEDGQITKYNITLPTSVGNTSIPKGATGLDAFGLYPIVGERPAEQVGKRVSGPTYEFDGTQVNRVYTVEDIPLEEIKSKLIAEITEATQKRLDDFAKTRNYDGILSACTYATSSVPKFVLEGQYCVDVRDQTWATLYTIMSEVESGVRGMPSGFADIEPDLPVLTWPELTQ